MGKNGDADASTSFLHINNIYSVPYNDAEKILYLTKMVKMKNVIKLFSYDKL